MDQLSILQAYPWLKDDGPKNIIMGDDLDAALGTICYLLHNPRARLVGIYTQYNRIFFAADLSPADLEHCIYIDLDICKPNCRSLGHHIIRRKSGESSSCFKNNCNPNEILGRSIEHQFQEKYPLGTVHFLIWLYGILIPPTEYATSLIWLADSSFINGQSHRFRKNVGNWVHRFMHCPALISGFYAIDTPDFETQMIRFQKLMLEHGLNKGDGQVRSRHFQLKGFQCQPTGAEDESEMGAYIRQIFAFITSITGWEIPDHQLVVTDFRVIKGLRRSGLITDVLQNRLIDDFVIAERVFSFVFPFKDRINFTTF